MAIYYDEWPGFNVWYSTIRQPVVSEYVRRYIRSHIRWEQVLRGLNVDFEDFRVRIKRSGVVVIKCSLHSEYTPSMWLRPDHSFVCYGCGNRGDIIGFAHKIVGFVTEEDVVHFFRSLPSPLPGPGQLSLVFD